MSNSTKVNYGNPKIPGIISDIKASPIYRRFLDSLRHYEIKTIYDIHTHVSSGREDLIDDTPSAYLPEFPFSIEDVNHLYDTLFRSEGIHLYSVVFDTPLNAYSMAKRNDRLLRRLATMPAEESRKVIPFAVVTPDMPRHRIQEYVERGARGFKMTPRITSPCFKRGTITDIALADMLNPEALRVANAHALPLVVHLPQLVVQPRMKQSLKDELGQIAIKYPDLRIVLAHLGQAQTPAKIEDLLDWIEKNALAEVIWMDISAVSVPSVLAIALSSDVKLVFGTDIDFSLTERGKYIMFKYANGQRVLAEPEDNGTVVTTLVSTSFGNKLKGFVADEGIDLDAPLLLFQLEGIIDAADRLTQNGKSWTQMKSILENLFFRNAESLLKDQA